MKKKHDHKNIGLVYFALALIQFPLYVDKEKVPKT